MGATNSTGNNMKAAKATYESFVGRIWVAVPVITVIVAFVVLLIA
ncbi:MAG: hypothetical protein ACKVOL_08720 [Novosphingobium sp.]